MDATLGEVVYSKSGRDSGRQFIVVDILDENYVLISDGSYRRLEKPKKKKKKHLKFTGIVLESINHKLKDNLKISNAEIRKALADVNKDL